ncbi:hypothetical protein JMJ35_010204 [Cladonia borealis]|uniref:Copper acquisition factor BIM1-like domain-containing protein n=1 Tax=Cladonia borealis TaxID=184061 RepID=A0AA39QRM8_9LECA|nr:hypothetical protein JMJ35_010204 [Cladonia borealis]
MPLRLQLPDSFLLRTIYTLLILLTPTTYALFQLNYPPARGYNTTTLPLFPCGGYDTPTNRTPFPLVGGPVQLYMEQDRAEVQVLLGLGSDVEGGFDVVVVGIFEEVGMGGFCVGGVVIPQDLGIEEGMNGTIQVVSSGDGEGGGGLYNCADITFSSTALLGPCINGTGVTATGYSGPYTNANETGDDNGTSTPIGSVPAAPQSKGAARKMELGVWGSIMGGIITTLLW